VQVGEDVQRYSTLNGSRDKRLRTYDVFLEDQKIGRVRQIAYSEERHGRYSKAMPTVWRFYWQTVPSSLLHGDALPTRDEVACFLARADRHPPASTPQESLRSWADMGWRVMDESGACGKTYELSLMFSWPNMVDGDATVRDLRMVLIGDLIESGARDPVTRMLAVGPMIEVTGTGGSPHRGTES